MKQHVFNLYPVTNQDDLRISYRFVEVDGELGLGRMILIWLLRISICSRSGWRSDKSCRLR